MHLRGEAARRGLRDPLLVAVLLGVELAVALGTFSALPCCYARAWHLSNRSSLQLKRRVSRLAEQGEREIVYNYFSQDYALVAREQRKFDLGEWLSELLPWSAAELQARDLLDQDRPGWRNSPVGPDGDLQLRRRFRAVAAVAGSEELALMAMQRNIAIVFFGERQINRAAQVLVSGLGREKAAVVVQKNPGALTIDPKSLEDNLGSVVLVAEIIDVAVKNGQVSVLVARAFGFFIAVSLSKALFDVVNLRLLSPS